MGNVKEERREDLLRYGFPRRRQITSTHVFYVLSTTSPFTLPRRRTRWGNFHSFNPQLEPRREVE